MPKKPIVITITSNKGGVGKTTSAAAIADIVSRDYNVLLVDTDPQGNCAAKFGLDITNGRGSLGDYLNDVVLDNVSTSPLNYLKPPAEQYQNLDVLVGGKQLKNQCYDYIFSVSAAKALKSFQKIFDQIAALDHYDYIIVDTPPTYGNEMSAILRATDYALIPTIAESDSVEGADTALKFISDAREDNPDLKIAGIFLNRTYDKDSTTQKVEPFIRQAWGENVLKTRVPDNRAAVSRAINESEPVTRRQPDSKASKAFFELTKEVLSRVDIR
jgi:chromosome partitioning protein